VLLPGLALDGDPPTSFSLLAGIASVHHHAWLEQVFLHVNLECEGIIGEEIHI
jgi:hypothetical protein